MDLFGPSAVRSYGGNCYTLVIVDDYYRKVKESLNVTFDETPPPSKTSPLVDDNLDEEEAIKVTKKKNLENNIEDETLEIDEIVNIKESRNHPLENIIGNLNQRTLRSQAQNQSNFFCFISTIEPKNVNEALTYESWIVAMQEELYQFIANDAWELVLQLRNMTIIGTKWVFRNKLDENVARLESIRILLAYACALDFKLFQMDVKSAFLNGFINEEVYVAQPQGFIDFEKPDHVYKLKKALYGLKQALKAWYDILKAFLIKHEYKMGMVDNTLFTKKKSSNLIIVHKYVDDIIFGSTCQDMCDEFAKIMHDEFEMSMMGQVRRIRHEEEIDVHEYQILTREIVPTLKPLEEMIRETFFVWGSYVLYDHVMNHIAAQQERKTRKDCGTRRGRHSTSSSSAFDQLSSSHLNDDDDDRNGKGTLSPIRYVNSLTNEVP
ncbi:retrovirus-related pol polyprotein from transposon TNT 1-94 [Tanacetum coccineum]